MVDQRIEKLKKDVRACVGHLVVNESKSCPALYKTLQEIRDCGWPAFLCGGAIRDMLLSRGQIVPRDLDIIFGYVTMEEMSSLFADYGNKRRTRLGGLSLQIKDWTIDAWPLSETWAFKEKHVIWKGFADFPKTTFLDVEAVAVQLFSRKRQKRVVYSKGFFEAILKKIIEINLEDNPYPALCIVKSLVVANRYKFALGPKLAKYIEYHAGRIEIEELLEIYKVRYGAMHLSADKLNFYMKAIREHLRLSSKQPVRLPSVQSRDSFNDWLWSGRSCQKTKYLFSAK